MQRRSFIKKGIATTSLATMGVFSVNAMQLFQPQKDGVKQNRLDFAPHLGMFKHLAGNDPIDQLNFMADRGFTAFEDNEMKNRTVSLQDKMAQTMAKRNITMGVFVAHKIYWKEPNLASGNLDLRKEFLQEIEESVEVAKRVNAKWMTVVPGHIDMGKSTGFQTANVTESLKQASGILEKHDLIMVLEPLNFRDHPGMFLSRSPQAYEICKSVDSPSCKILFDIYHQQIQEGNLIPNIEKCWDEIAYFQIGDNPGRNEPTTGEINFENVFKYISANGFQGILGMEHGNSMDGKEGEEKVIKVYQEFSNI